MNFQSIEFYSRLFSFAFKLHKNYSKLIILDTVTYKYIN